MRIVDDKNRVLKRGIFLAPWVLALGMAASPGISIAATAAEIEADAVRLLEQATFGPTDALVAHVQSVGAAAFVEEQFAAPATRYTSFPDMPSTRPATCIDDKTLPLTPASYCARDNYTRFQLQREFFRNAVTAPDQLRQRVAFALSQMLVISGLKINQVYAMQRYQQMLADLAFDNFSNVLTQVTLSPAMGHYLDMVNNAKANATTGVEPNENYAREILQLFSIGTVELNLDGTPLLDAAGHPIATYGQDDVEGFAHVFTGWTYPAMPGTVPRTGNNPSYFYGAMEQRSQYHDFGAKVLLNDVKVPANQTMSVDLAVALRNIFVHANVGPFVSKQLIQKLVTSNPSPAYVARVATVFNDNGAGVRGDLKAVVRAILLDTEARASIPNDPAYGRLREPAQFIVGVARALNAKTDGVYFRAQVASMDQQVFEAPSVFNFYPPDYVIPGKNVLGPEFALQSTASAFARINFVNSLVFTQTIAPDATVYGATGTQLDWSGLTALASDPNALVSKLNRLLLHGTLSAAGQAAIVKAVNAVAASDSLTRAKTAFYLVASSAQYQVER